MTQQNGYSSAEETKIVEGHLNRYGTEYQEPQDQTLLVKTGIQSAEQPALTAISQGATSVKEEDNTIYISFDKTNLTRKGGSSMTVDTGSREYAGEGKVIHASDRSVIVESRFTLMFLHRFRLHGHTLLKRQNTICDSHVQCRYRFLQWCTKDRYPFLNLHQYSCQHRAYCIQGSTTSPTGSARNSSYANAAGTTADLHKTRGSTASETVSVTAATSGNTATIFKVTVSFPWLRSV